MTSSTMVSAISAIRAGGLICVGCGVIMRVCARGAAAG
jgi:hypothetical protein